MISTMDEMLTSLMMDSLVDSATCWRRKSFLHVHVLACGMLGKSRAAGGSPIHFREDAGLCESLEGLHGEALGNFP